MPPYFTISFVLFLFYSPFLLLLFIPSKTILHSNDFLYDVCKHMKTYHLKPLESLFCHEEQTIAIIKPDGYESHLNEIKGILKENGFHIVQSKVQQLTPAMIDNGIKIS
ncbi:unnamed protein product [Cunninghamella blakesleeana]